MLKVLVLLGIIAAVLAANLPVPQLVRSNHFFTPNSYQAVAKSRTGNFMFSPLSLELALLLLDAGAKGSTDLEIRWALDLLSDSNQALAKEVKTLISSLRRNNYYTFDIANGVFYEDHYSLNPAFQSTATKLYNARVEDVKFSENAKAANTINSWVARETHNKIKNLISPSSLDAATRLVLVNAVYFKGLWDYRFLAKKTVRGEYFYKTEAEKINVDMMVLEDKYLEYLDCERLNAQIVRLPLQGGDAAMVILLPNNVEGLRSLEASPEIFTPRNLTLQAVNIRLPKFLIESTFNLNSVLKELGIKTIFDDSQADLSGLAGRRGDLIVSDVSQKTYIDVSENGIEAAAATSIDVVLTSEALPPLKAAKVFNANHPFVFYIEIDNLIVFVGRVEAPTRSSI